jgi:hypothetical protein
LKHLIVFDDIAGTRDLTIQKTRFTESVSMIRIRQIGAAILPVLMLSSVALGQYGSEYTTMPTMVKDIVVKGNSDGNFENTSNVDYEFWHPTDSSSGGNVHVYRQANDDDGYTGNDAWQEITDNYQNQGTTGTPVAGAPWFPQSVEFDNHGGVSHNHQGNLLVANFGNAFSGFELYTINTNGSGDSWSSVWSSHAEAGGNYGVDSGPTYDATLDFRGGGVSVSPFNDKVSFVSSDTGALWVLDYYGGGSAAGTGIAQWGQTPVVNAGVWAGNPRVSAPLAGFQAGKSGSTQGSTWLNNHTVAIFTGFGEIVTADMSDVVGGLNKAQTTTGDRTDQTQPNMNPTEFSSWTIAKNVLSTSSQYTDIDYNPEIDPLHVYLTETRNDSFQGWLYRVEYDPATGAFGDSQSWQLPDVAGNVSEPREMAFDSQGNLWLSGYRNPPPGTVVGAALIKITDVANNFGENAAVSHPLVGDHFGGFAGMDVASAGDVLYDVNGDGTVGPADLNLLLTSYNANVHQDPTTGFAVDFNNDKVTNAQDLNLLLTDYNKSYVSGSGAGVAALGVTNVPEPASAMLLVFGSALLFFKRRSR